MARVLKVQKVASVLAVLAVIAVGTAVPASASAITMNSNWATVIPTIDGVFHSGEWSDAAVTDLQGEPYFPPPPCWGGLYVKNDVQYLYLLADVTADQTESPQDRMDTTIYWSGGTTDFLGTRGFGPSPNDPTNHRIYEVRVPLQNLPDWSYSPGNTVAMLVTACNAPWDSCRWWPIAVSAEPGYVILAQAPGPASIPAVSLWGTVGMVAVLGALIAWSVRRRLAIRNSVR